jgi:hypothetical protein
MNADGFMAGVWVLVLDLHLRLSAFIGVPFKKAESRPWEESAAKAGCRSMSPTLT